jgi:hypothetical protein
MTQKKLDALCQAESRKCGEIFFLRKCQKELATSRPPLYSLRVTNNELEIIRRVAKIHGFHVRETNPEECKKLAIHNERSLDSSDFVWFEGEGFDSFFRQIYEFGYERGYDAASR